MRGPPHPNRFNQGQSPSIEWCEISGSPTEQERQILMAALEQYVRNQNRSATSPWSEIPLEARDPETAQGWSGQASWNGLLPRS